MKLTRYLLVGAAALAATVAIAQTIPVPSALPVGQTDLIQIVKGGVPSAQSTYAPLGSVGSIESYSYQVPITGFSITSPNYSSLLYLNPAGALANGTVIMPALVNDGQRFCVVTSAAVGSGAFAVTANTGQTIVGTATTPTVANTQQCWVYRAAALTWYRVA